MKENTENLKVQAGENFSGTNVTDSDNRGSGLNINELLLSDANLWRASDIDKRSHTGTGYVNLDNILPGGGWPKKGLVEIINQHYGVGELQLLIPLMRSIIKQGKSILWVSPPHIVYAPALLQAGIDTERILVVDETASCKNALWSIEKALRSKDCGLVLTWQTWLSFKVLRRLQIAAENGGTLGFIFKRRDNKSSPSSMRLQIKNTMHGYHNFDEALITVIKARGNLKSRDARVKLYQHHLQHS